MKKLHVKETNPRVPRYPCLVCREQLATHRAFLGDERGAVVTIAICKRCARLTADEIIERTSKGALA